MRRYYQILGVSPNATSEEIKAAWLFSIKAFHPDKFAGSSPQQQRVADERTKAINEAYSVLSDSLRRSDYDREFAHQARAEAAPPRSESAPPPRSESAPPPRPKSASPPPRSAPDSSRGEATTYRKNSLVRIVGDLLSPSGRIGRAQFIVRTVIIVLSFYVATMVWKVLGTAFLIKADLAVSVAGLLTLLGMYLLAVQAGKRLHDSDYSARWLFAGVIGIGAVVLPFVLLFSHGTVGANRFGSRSVTPKGMKIFASILGGLPLLGACVAFIVSQSASSRSNPTASYSSIATVPTTPSHSAGRVIKGTNIQYSLTTPLDWTANRKGNLPKEASEDLDIVVSHKASYIAVIAEETDIGDKELVVKVMQDALTERNSDAVFADPGSVLIDGKEWSAFTVRVTIKKIPFAYQYYIYTGSEGTFQILGWTFANLFKRDVSELQRVMQSFKFPPIAKSSSRATASPFDPDAYLAESTPKRESLLAPGRKDVWDLPHLAKDARKAILLIVGFDAKGKVVKTGSGFFISEDGRIVTNRHVISNVMRATAKTEDGAMYSITGVLATSVPLDLAVLKAQAKGVPFLVIEKFAFPEVGSRVAVIGSPIALEGTLSEGIVAAIRTEDDGTWIQISAPLSPGSSGSPVLNSNGRVIGVATLNSGGRFQNLNFARSSRDLVGVIEGLASDAKVETFEKAIAKSERPVAVPSPSLDKSLASPSAVPMESPRVSPSLGALTLPLATAIPQEVPASEPLRGERFPVTRTRSLTIEEIRDWNDEKLRYAINEMFARHGAEIENPMVRKQFVGFDWYHPVAGKTYDAAQTEFSAVENYNVHLLSEYRKTRSPAAPPPTKVTISDARGKLVFKGTTNASGTFVTANLKPGNYIVQFNATSEAMKTNHYAIVLSGGTKRVSADRVPGEKFGAGGVAVRITLANHPAASSITGWVRMVP